jgi:hypothetical protein
VELAEDVELFHTPGHDSDGYATIDIEGHRETWPVNSRGFKRWLAKRFYDEHRKVPGAHAFQDALNVIGGKAVHEGAEYPVATRVAQRDGRIWLDLADAGWRTVRIGPKGWAVVRESPIKFVRRRGVLALPEPVLGGSIDELRPLLNVPKDDDWVMFVAWIVAGFRPDRPFPILSVNGEQGSAKSTFCKMGRNLIDPNEAPLRRPPRDERDLMIAAQNGWVVSFDNLSGIRPDLSDGLCSLATGGDFGTRALYSDDDEKLFSSKRPVLLNGIEDVATRSDLIDRSIVLTLPAIPDGQRRDEDTLWKRYERIRPRVLGALLDAVATGLLNLPDVKLGAMPRMADFARWVVACEPALGWRSGTFLRAYNCNRAAANQDAIDSSPIARYLLGLIGDSNNSSWTGTATRLLAKLNGIAGDSTKRLWAWPQSPRGLSGQLRRLAPNLRRANVHVEFEHTGERQQITIRRAQPESAR